MVTETKFSVPRVSPRFAFVAEAEVLGATQGKRAVARVTQLSDRGCYIDTVSTFPTGTELHFRIRYGCSSCEVPGKVLYSRNGLGMGILFGEVSHTHRATLDSWLEELSRKSN